MNHIAQWKQRIGANMLFRNTMSMTTGGGIRLALQAVYFVMIARSLGPSQYGAFIGVAALIGVLSPFAMLGTGNLMIQSVARDRTTFRESWGNALEMTAIASGLLLVLVLLACRLFLPRGIPLLLVVFVGLADLFFAGIVGLAGQAFQACEKLHRTAWISVTLTAARGSAALLLFVFVPRPTAMIWSGFYFFSTVLAAAYAFGAVHYRLGSPAAALGRLIPRLREGFYFSVSLSSQSMYNNIDKAMLVRLSTLEAAGIYGIAYRLVDLAFQPIGALLASTYAGFFRHGTDGLAGTTRFAKRLLPYSISYGVLAAVGLAVAAPVLPRVVGRNYGTAVEALRWLAPLVSLKSVHYFLADSLTGADFQGHRTGVQLLIAALNLALNFWLIPAYGWKGAAWASLASDGMLVVGLMLMIAVLDRKARLAEVGCGAEPGIAP
jgi:O-antigen/teichoic acid export membrane protein